MTQAPRKTAPSATGDGFGANDWLIEEMHAQYANDPDSVDESWRRFFESRAEAFPRPGESHAVGGGCGDGYRASCGLGHRPLRLFAIGTHFRPVADNHDTGVQRFEPVLTQSVAGCAEHIGSMGSGSRAVSTNAEQRADITQSCR